MKKVVFLLLAVLMISTGFMGCDSLASALASKAKHITLDPDIINIKVGETIEVTAKMTDGNNKPVTVDNSKFQWSIVTGEDAIEIVANANTVKITAKKTLVGNAMIRISHPDALTYIQRVVHISAGEASGGNTGNTGNTDNGGSNTGSEGGNTETETIPEEEKGDIHFLIEGNSQGPNFGSFVINEGKSLTIKLEIKTQSNDVLKVDNKKFKWSKSLYPDLIDIEPNGNTIKVTVKKKDGNKEPRITVTHPYAKQSGRLDIEIKF